jgi:hypothetical protein
MILVAQKERKKKTNFGNKGEIKVIMCWIIKVHGQDMARIFIMEL